MGASDRSSDALEVLVGAGEIFFEIDLNGEELTDINGYDTHGIVADGEFDATLEIVSVRSLR